MELVSARGTPDLLDIIRVNHVSGGTSIIGLKTYAAGREKFQGETLQWVWLDEEPPIDIYTEALTRTNLHRMAHWWGIRCFLNNAFARKLIFAALLDVEYDASLRDGHLTFARKDEMCRREVSLHRGNVPQQQF